MSLLLGSVWLGSLPAQAQTQWTGATSTDWFTAGNWNPAAVPGAGTSVQINTATPNATVAGAAGAQANQLTLGELANQTGDLTVTGAGSTLALTNATGFFLVGNFGTGDVTVSGGGVLTTFTAAIGNQTGSTGSVTVTGAGSQWNLTPIFAFHVGSSGTGTLDVLAGGQVTSTIFGMDLGADNGAMGTVTVSGAGSTLTVGSTTNIGSAAGGTGAMQASDGGLLAFQTVTVGSLGQGELIVDTGADMTAGQLTVGSSAQGDATFTGAGVTVAVTNALRVGLNAGGNGTLTIADGAVATSSTGALGVNTGATGAATVTGTGSRWTMTSTLQIGQAANGGAGALEVLDGGQVDASAFTGHNSAQVTVDGANSQLNLLGAPATTFTMGATGANNRLDVTGGAALATKNANLSTVAGSGIAVNVSGTNSTWTANSITLGGAGTSTMTVGDNAAVNSTGDFIVDGTADTSLTISGGATVTHNPGVGGLQFRLGVDGHGSLRIESGGKLETQAHPTPGFGSFVFLARNAGSTATAVVTGAGSNWDFHNDVIVGSSGIATLDILDGATVTGDQGMTLGFNAGSSGTVLVSGANSALVLSEGPPLSGVSNITVGTGGTGSLRIENGARVAAQGVTVGSAFDTNTVGMGTLVVTGPTSRLDLNVSAFQSLGAGGNGGTGTIDVLDGAVVTVVGQGHLGQSVNFIGQTPTQALGNGTLTVNGNGSRVTFTQTLDIGEQATGTLNVQNGGFVSNTDGYLGSFTNAVGSAGIGTATVTGAGSTWQNSGTLRVGDFGAGTLNVLNGGLVTNANAIIASAVNSIGNATVDGAGSTWTSTGTLAIGNLGTGTLTILNAGTVNANGASIGALGTLNIGSGGAAGALNSPTLANAGVLRFNHTGDTTFAAAISGAGNVVKDAAGTTTLTGISSYTGTTTVNAGLLNISGSIAPSPVTVNAGGTLGGVGVAGPTTVAGNIAPGNSIGQIDITNTYVQASGSTYTVELNTAISDLINVVGAPATATIQANAAVSVIAAPGFYTLGQRYTILTAPGGVTGTYASLTDNAPFVDFQFAYDANNVYLDVIFSGVPFQQIAQTRNQIAAASGVESLGSGNPIFDAVAMLDTPNALRAFDLLSGEIHASMTGALLDGSQFIRNAINGRLQQHARGPMALFAPRLAALPLNGDEDDLRGIAFDTSSMAYAPRKRSRVRATAEKAIAPEALPVPSGPVTTAWAHSFGNWGRIGGDGNAAGLKRTDGGFITGMDVTLRPNPSGLWRIGLAGGFQRTDVSAGDRSSSGGVETAHVAAYAGAQRGAFALRGGLAYARHEISTDRSIAFPGFSDRTRAGYHATTMQAFGEAGYAFAHGRSAFEPFVGLAHVSVHTDSMVESGGTAALVGAARNADATFTTAGLRAATPLPGLPDITAKGSLGWRHAFGVTAPEAQLAFAAGGLPFVVSGTPISRDVAAVDVGVDGELWRNATLGISYSAQLSGRMQAHGVNASFLSRF